MAELRNKKLNKNAGGASTKATPEPVRQQDIVNQPQGWAPNSDVIIKLLLAIRIICGWCSNISDCDETFNYWEPLHYLMYGSGLQTWEYSPLYAIRSYAYLSVHAVPARLINLFTQNKIFVFFGLRIILGMTCAACESYFYSSVKKSPYFGPRVAMILLLFLMFSPGMFIASAAFLPSSFCLCVSTLSFGFWINGHYSRAILATALSSLLGWPFCAALGVPLAIDILFRKGLIKTFFIAFLSGLVFVLGPIVLIDSSYYAKFVIAPLNIVLYNVLSENTSSELYGKEPLSFYFINGFLNFNIAFVFALMAPIIVVLSDYLSYKGLKQSGVVNMYLAPLFVWIAIFFPSTT